MDKDKLSELETLLDGLEYDIHEIELAKFRAVEKLKDIKELLQDKEEKF